MSTVKRFCFWADDDAVVTHLITQVLDGTKTATVRAASSWGVPRNVFDDARFDVGDHADLFDNAGQVHARLRVTDIYTCRFDTIPEKLWRAEAEPSADAFRASHFLGWPDLTLTDDFLLTAIHFERID
jgi:uncharacterized protein YhfF